MLPWLVFNGFVIFFGILAIIFVLALATPAIYKIFALIPLGSTVVILGAWYNVLLHFLQLRRYRQVCKSKLALAEANSYINFVDL